MSTRCEIVLEKTTAYPDVNGHPNVNNGMHRLAFYRHHDGYPTGTGFDLVTKVAQIVGEDYATVHNAAAALAAHLPLADYEKTQPESHGDIDYKYVVNFDDGCTVVCYKRPSYSEGRDDDVDAYRQWPAHVLARWEYIYRDGRNLGLALNEISIRRSFMV